MNRYFIQYDSEFYVTSTHFMPFDSVNGLNKTEAELLSIGALIEPYTQPANVEGKSYRAKYVPETNSVVFEEVDVRLSDYNELVKTVAGLQTENATQEEMIAGMSYELMMLQPESTTYTLGEGSHSPKFNMIKIWYTKGFWTAEMVADAVTKNVITEAERVEIVGA